MTKTEPLIAILKKARRAAEGTAVPGRWLAGRSTPAHLRAVLAEIDETVLPRALRFAIGDEARLVIEVRGRRAVRITEVQPETGEAYALRSKVDSAEAQAEEKLAAVAALVAGFCETEGPLSVEAAPSDLPASVVDKGVAPAALRETLAELIGDAPDEDEEPPAEPPPRWGAPTSDAAGKKKPGRRAAPRPLRERRPSVRTGPTIGSVQALAESAAMVARLTVLADMEGNPKSVVGTGASLPAKNLGEAVAAQVALNAPFWSKAFPGPSVAYLGHGGTRDPALCFAADEAEIAAATTLPNTLKPLVTSWQRSALGSKPKA
jgi:hypothetical protein